MLRKLVSFLVFAVILCGLTNGDVFAECEGVDSMYIGVPEDCSFFIFCHGEESFQDSCPEDSPYFSTIDQTCDITTTICGNRPYVDPNVTASSSTPMQPNITQAPITATSFITRPSAVNTTTTTTQTTTISSTTTIISSPTTTLVVPMTCPSTDDPHKAIFLPNAKSCSDYFLCYHGEPLPMHCSNMLHFDIKQQKCDYPENVNCQMDFVTPREQCLPHTFDVYPHASNCNYYYLCSYGYLMVMQCPLKMGWDYEKRACALLPKAKCYNLLQRF